MAFLSSSPHLTIFKPLNKLSIHNHNKKHVQFKKHVSLKINSCLKTKVFEDKCEGIICYRDELSGEIVCEGYDEGPRYCQQYTQTSYQSKDAEIMNILMKRWEEIMNRGEVKNVDEKGDVVVKEDINWNGSFW